MRILKLDLKKRSYNIIIGNNIIGLLGKYLLKLNITEAAYIITNPSIKNLYGKIITNALKKSGLSVKFRVVPDTEKSKSIKTASSVINDMARYNKKRRIFIVALGGGVIGDLAGFVASIYKRGIPYVQVPTTLLAQVDSAIGGKTAVDLMQGKNLLGAFYQPRLVLSDIAFLKTLDKKQLQSGLAEVIKYALIEDAPLFAYLENNYRKVLNLEIPALEFIVTRSSRIKSRIVQGDEKEEKGLRTALNFGHTVGHAIEAAGKYKKYNHGQAIALGMLAACEISENLGLINNTVTQRIESLIRKVGLPVKIDNIAIPDIIKAHYWDKKFIGPVNRFVLIKDIGKTEIRKNIPLKIIKEALKKKAL